MDASNDLSNEMYMLIVNDRKCSEKFQKKLDEGSSSYFGWIKRVFELFKEENKLSEYYLSQELDRVNICYIIAEHYGRVNDLPEWDRKKALAEDMERNPPPAAEQPFTNQYRNLAIKPKSEETIMNFITTVTHEINGQNTDSMTVEQLISHIAQAEKKVEDLENIKVESKAVKKEITRINKFIKDTVRELDAKK